MIYYKKKSLIKKVINKIIKKKEFLKFPLLSFFKRLFFFISIFLFILYSIYLFLLPKYLDNSIIEDVIEANSLKLAVGFSENGPFNKPIVLSKPADRKKIFGELLVF
jgi:hypothetical protein